MRRARTRFGSAPARGRCRPVLVLDGDPHGDAATVRVRWVRDPDGEVPDGIGGTLAEGRPPGAVRDGEPVTLVIRDAALDIERLASQGFAATPLGAWQRYRLARERRRERHRGQANGTLGWLGRHASSDARAAVQRETLDPAWIERLEPLVRDGLVIAEAVLPEHLLAAAHGRRAVPRFTVLPETRHVRHVLVIDGIACFSRRVASSDDPHTVARDVVASLVHALDRWSLTRVALDASGLPARGAIVLDALLGEVPARIESCGDPGTIEPDRALARLATGRSGRRRGSVTLAPLTDAWRDRTTLRRLDMACAAGGALVLGAAAHAITLGPDSVARAGALDLQRASMLSRLETVRADTLTLHAQPERAARFLMVYERLGEPADTAPDELLAGIARTLSLHEGLTLDAIAWSHRTSEVGEDLDGVVFDEAVYTDAANLPFARRSEATRVAVELDGRVTGADTLREAQARLHAFVDEVRTIAVLHDCRILASPLSTAAHGDDAALVVPATEPATGSTASAPAWRVRCASSRGAS